MALVDGDGGVDKLETQVNIDAVMALLENHRKNLYTFGAAVDTKDAQLGNASGVAILFRYMDLDGDAHALAAQLNAMFDRLKVFIDTHLSVMGKGDFRADKFDVVFNMDMPVNEGEVIDGLMKSAGLLSMRTMLEQHPYVKDVEVELERILTVDENVV